MPKNEMTKTARPDAAAAASTPPNEKKERKKEMRCQKKTR
jgi:hypothetical protein